MQQEAEMQVLWHVISHCRGSKASVACKCQQPLSWQQRALTQADPSPMLWQEPAATKGSFRHSLYV